MNENNEKESQDEEMILAEKKIEKIKDNKELIILFQKILKNENK
jgi:hypothetical protein